MTEAGAVLAEAVAAAVGFVMSFPAFLFLDGLPPLSSRVLIISFGKSRSQEIKLFYFYYPI